MTRRRWIQTRTWGSSTPAGTSSSPSVARLANAHAAPGAARCAASHVPRTSPRIR